MQTLTTCEPETPQSVEAALPIVELVELVNTLQREQRQATPQERALLAKWTGWGSLAPAFEPAAKGKWADIKTRLQLLLGPDGMEAASAATPTSFFTTDSLTATIWQLATRLGFSGGRVLEPGCGSGAILAAAPAGLSLEMTGIEREPFSARVAQLRLPAAKILTAPFEAIAIANDSFDLVVGNVPFSSVRIYDPDCAINFSLHNYFLWRTLAALRPGGLAILITSLYTLDAKRDVQRSLLSSYGSLLGALRLPSKAHQQAGTEVITDLLVLQRHTPAITWEGQPWMDLSPDVVPGISVNEYFACCPRQIIGTPIVDRGMYRADELRVIAPSNLTEAIEEGVERLVETALSNGACYLPPPDYTIISDTLVRREDGLKEGSYHLLEDRLVQIRDGETQLVTRHVAELTMLVRLRDTTIELLEAERDLDRPDAALVSIRERLDACYDAYVRTYGPIHRAIVSTGSPDPETGEQTVIRRRPPALSAFRLDPDYAVVLGLEQYDSATKQAQKALIFRQRVHTRPARKTTTDSPAEALALCLDAEGTLNFETIGRLLSCDASDVPARLGELVYEDPVSGTWLTAEAYLCGNVQVKVGVARQAAAADPERFTRNVTALEAILPEALLPEEISAVLGAPWIAPTDIEQFCQDTFGTRPTVSYEPLTATWEVTLPSDTVLSLAATSDWGTRVLHAYRLVEIGLNKGVPVVYDETEEKRVRDIEETLAAQDKLQSIQARFRDWVWEKDERTLRLANEYNTRFNAEVPQHYNGSHLSFPGMNETWVRKLYPWQRDFIWRMVSSPAALCGHPVGAGKTTTEIAGAMTLRRFGLITKAAIVVPNHLLEQIAAEAQRLYPGARVLIIARDDLSRERRTLFAARVALGDYDLVIMTHASLNALGVHPETERAYLEQRITIYRQALLDLEEEQGKDRKQKRIIKRLETTIEKMRQRQRKLMRMPRDHGVTFEQLGVSYLIIDEAHLYKNLGLPTNIQGLQVQPSKRAMDLEMKLRWLAAHNEGRPFASFFTATPISNSTVEAYVQAWYLNQGLLYERGLASVDAFASTFIELQTRVEVSPNGASFRLHTRPSRFVNMPEFLSLFAQFADLRGPEILDDQRPARREHTITIPPDDAVQRFVDDLVERSELIQQGKPRDMGAGRLDNMLWVTTHGRAAAIDLSLVGVRTAQTPKLSTVASIMLAVYRRVQRESALLEGEFKGLQIGFCDLGTPNEESEQIYGILKRLLIDGGVPAHGIRYIHEARTDTAKSQLFEQCRNGAVAILLGSTALMGTGTNIQTRCAAIHHIDAPWRPDEVEQREGRGHRPGNQYPVVEIYRYVQQRTFDAYSWQILTTKAVFFDQMRRGKVTTREMDALGETALSYAQVKAAATGDPLVLEQAELDVTIAQLQRLQTAHLRTRKRDAQDALQARSNRDEALTWAASLRALASNVARCTRPGLITRTGEYFTGRSAIGAVIAQAIQTQLDAAEELAWIGSWSGEKVTVQIETWGTYYSVHLLIGTNALRIQVQESWMDAKQQWRFAEAIEQAVASASDKAQRQERTAERADTQAKLLEQQAAQPFPRAAELQARLLRKAELDTYTALVAAVKGDPNRQEELAARRAQLLKNAPTFAFESVETPSLPAAKSTSAVVPRFGEWWQGKTRTTRKSRSRRGTPPEQAGTQLNLFPDLLEQGA